MGQYHVIYNIDKKEYLHAHTFNAGLKLLEFPSSYIMMVGFNLLLSNSNGRGGGDLYIRHDYDKITYKKIETSETKQKEDILSIISGRWAGDRIVVQGDYAENNDKAYIEQDDIENNYIDISKLVLNVLTLDDYLKNEIPETFSWKYLIHDIHVKTHKKSIKNSLNYIKNISKEKPQIKSPTDLINETKGKCFRIKFEKKNGEIRELTVRTGVTKLLKNKNIIYNDNKKNLNNIVLYDMNNRSYKTIIKQNIISITYKGITHNFK